MIIRPEREIKMELPGAGGNAALFNPGFSAIIALAMVYPKAFIACLLAAETLFATPGALPPPPVRSPEEQRKTFRFAESGYRIELVACEPMVQDPVAIAFDGEGKLWVAEMRGFMLDINATGSREAVGRVSVLEDTDGDGRMDQSRVFADQLILPRALSLHPDGALIGENKALHFYPFSGGERELIDPGYACDSVEHSANGLLRAMDNWIYNAKEGSRYRRTAKGWKKETTETRGQWGICQDNQGRLFYNFNHSQLHADSVPPNALTRNPNHDPSAGLGTAIALNNDVFPIRPTPAANRAYLPDSLDAQGRIKQFTSACAPLVYRGTLFPELAGDCFVCEPVGNLIKRNRLSGSGLTIAAAPAYPDRDFLASSDERFRPCWLAEGPDGAIYVGDLYRGVVQDAPHMSPYLREHSLARNLTEPVHLGRIWRIVPDKPLPAASKPAFSEMTASQLAATLADPSGWWRDQAQKYLVEKNLREAIPALRAMALNHPSREARLHSLWTLEGLGEAEPETLAETLEDNDPAVASAALRVLFSLGLNHGRIFAAISQQIDQPDELALQQVLTLGDLDIPDAARFSSLLKISSARLQAPLFRDAVLSSLRRREAAFLDVFLEALANAPETPGQAFLMETLSQAIVKSRDAAAVESLLDRLASLAPDDWKAKALWSGLAVHSPALTRQAMVLSAPPAAVAGFPALRSLFAWPGHQPAPPPLTATRPLTAAEEKRFVRGRQVFVGSCAACHGPEGQGIRHLAPPLAGSDWVTGPDTRLGRILLHGLTGPLRVSGKDYEFPEIQLFMPPLAVLTNADIAAVLTYIRREWGHGAEPVTEGSIAQLRVRFQGRAAPWTENELNASP